MTNTDDNKELEQLIERVAYAMKTMAVPMYPKDDEQSMVELELADFTALGADLQAFLGVVQEVLAERANQSLDLLKLLAALETRH